MTDKRPLDSSETPDPKALFAQLFESARRVADIERSQLAEKTKVPLNFINSIESGTYDLSISKVYTRGFLRILCKALNVDENDYLEAFELAYPEKPVKDSSSIEAISEVHKATGQTSLLSREGKQGLVRQVGQGVRAVVSHAGEKFKAHEKNKVAKEQNKETKLKVFLPIAAGILVTLGITFLTETPTHVNSKPVAEVPRIADTAGSKVNVLAAEDDNAHPVAEKQEQIVDSKDNVDVELEQVAASSQSEQKNAIEAPTVEVNPVSENSKVAITANADVRVKVKKDQEPQNYKEIAAGEKLEVDFNETAQLLIYDAGAVEVSYNGMPLGSLGEKGRIRKITFANQNAPTSPTSL